MKITAYSLCLAISLIPALSATIPSNAPLETKQSFVEKYTTPITAIASAAAGTVLGVLACILYQQKYSKRSPLTKEQYADCFKKVVRAMKDASTVDAQQKLQKWENANKVDSYTTIVLWEVLQDNKALFQPILDSPKYEVIRDAVAKNDKTVFVALGHQNNCLAGDGTTWVNIFTNFIDDLKSPQRERILAYANLKKSTDITKGSAASLPDFQTCNRLSDLCSLGCSSIDEYIFNEQLGNVNISKKCFDIFTAIGRMPSKLPEQITNLANSTSNIEFNAALDIAFDVIYEAAHDNNHN